MYFIVWRNYYSYGFFSSDKIIFLTDKNSYIYETKNLYRVYEVTVLFYTQHES